jgi:D-cysteine desulfhydrase family pyridoxal phosphate-dependent enzyme
MNINQLRIKTMIKELLNKFPRLHMSVLPTPIQKLEKLSGMFDANIYCMRDDLTGFAFGGNKTRKLDFLIADALSKGKDTIIGIGANQSNFCRLASAAAKVNGLETYLILAGEKPEKPTGNLLLDYIFDAKIDHISERADLAEAGLKLEQKLLSEGKKVYNMPSGGSTPVGILGYLEAFNEILEYSNSTGIHFKSIFHGSGSGGTQAGLVLGQTLTGWHGKITGISVGRSKQELTQVVTNHVKKTAEMIGKALDPFEVIADENYIGESYGKRTLGGEEAIQLFSKKEGILLDYVYTGKGAAGMIDYIRKGMVDKNENILFIHTGGNIELFE